MKSVSCWDLSRSISLKGPSESALNDGADRVPVRLNDIQVFGNSACVRDVYGKLTFWNTATGKPYNDTVANQRFIQLITYRDEESISTRLCGLIANRTTLCAEFHTDLISWQLRK